MEDTDSLVSLGLVDDQKQRGITAFLSRRDVVSVLDRRQEWAVKIDEEGLLLTS
jgi:hypothetical protein